MKLTALCLLLAGMAGTGSATIRVVTSLPDLADITRRIGGEKVQVDYIVRGDQNPHFIEVKPSYMMKLRSADLFLTIGMELELWAPQLVDGSRNAALQVVDLSRGIQKLEVPASVDASQGDVHRFGNPHYWLDPRNMRTVCGEIVDALAKVAPADERFFRANAEAWIKTLDGKIAEWESIMKPLAGRRVITFHKSWSYFAQWLGLTIADQVEPKPGIPPSPSHTAELIAKIRQGGIKVIIAEPFYDLSAPEKLAQATGASVVQLPTSVGGAPEAGDYIGLMDFDVKKLAVALQ
jgi:zinc/manganese transport system substrate-binding protein